MKTRKDEKQLTAELRDIVRQELEKSGLRKYKVGIGVGYGQVEKDIADRALQLFMEKPKKTKKSRALLLLEELRRYPMSKKEMRQFVWTAGGREGAPKNSSWWWNGFRHMEHVSKVIVKGVDGRYRATEKGLTCQTPFEDWAN